LEYSIQFFNQIIYHYNLEKKINLILHIVMLVDFQVMSLQQFITNKIINRIIKSMGKSSSSTEPKKSTGIVSLISAVGVLSSLLLHIPSKIGIGGMYAYAQQQQTGVAAAAADPLSSSLQIAQSKVQAATSPGAWGHGVPSLHNLSSQDLLMILGITGIGCIAAYLIVRIMLNRTTKEKQEEQKKMVMYQQQ
jgi:hypothetical protein